MRLETLISGLALAAGLGLAGGASAAGDAAAGKAIFAKTCQNCHSLDIGVNKVGPSLSDIINRKAGVVPGFEYSDALKNSGKTWTVEELDLYLSNPRGVLHGVKMYFSGLKTEAERADVIAYLLSVQQ
ncbi:c-type cytochrome [Methylocella tundrae]|uniref:Cytochrome c n=1 Tax=Methylocella tundrae TaxID=227605 RepID=A0A4U8Z008_METTU|nr:c-type cytochrome [Methylocella tundrae]WPP04877.1 c-type cytochrome [Methylocella tundrae]VFU07134.1 Cytochrome c [Methylocella tundrae]